MISVRYPGGRLFTSPVPVDETGPFESAFASDGKYIMGVY